MRIAFFARPKCRVDDCLSRPIHIVQLRTDAALEPRDELGRQRLAAAHHSAQGEAFVEGGLLNQKPEKRRHAVEN